jgi:hypothetical protein
VHVIALFREIENSLKKFSRGRTCDYRYSYYWYDALGHVLMYQKKVVSQYTATCNTHTALLNVLHILGTQIEFCSRKSTNPLPRAINEFKFTLYYFTLYYFIFLRACLRFPFLSVCMRKIISTILACTMQFKILLSILNVSGSEAFREE